MFKKMLNKFLKCFIIATNAREVNMREQKIKELKEEIKELIKQIKKAEKILDEEIEYKRRLAGNYFRIEKEAEEYKENLITKQKLKDLALRLNEGVKIDWKDPNKLKIFIALSITKDKIAEKALIKLIKSGV